MNTITIVDYSEKALAVIGETKAIKESLKSWGGSFNPGLTVNEERVAGWIFSKKKTSIDELSKLLGLSKTVPLIDTLFSIASFGESSFGNNLSNTSSSILNISPKNFA